VAFGTDSSPETHDGDTITSQPPRDLSDVVDKANVVLDSATSTMSNIQSISAKIDQGKGTMGALINDRRMFDDARTATKQAAVGAAAFTDDMDALKHNFFLRGFFKKRGYENSTELTAHEIPKLPTELPVKKFSFDGEFLFEHTDTAKLKNQSKLKEAGAFLEGNKADLVVIADSTGHAGDSSQNLVLSRARAMVVRDYIAKTFHVDDTHIKTKGLGEATKGETGKLEIIVYPAMAASK
jgi:outer membrane protein OmpA-like peptidoglycan-associated protein